MASLFSMQGRYAEAEPLYREALNTSRRTLGDEHPTTQWLMQAFPELYEAWDAAEPGQGHAAKADALRVEFGIERDETDPPADADGS